MVHVINKDNFKLHLKNSKEIIIDPDFVLHHINEKVNQIQIFGIDNVSIDLKFIDINKFNLKILVVDCSFRKIQIENSILEELFFDNVEIPSKENYLQFPYDFTIISSIVKDFRCDYCNFLGGAYITKSCEFQEIRISRCNVLGSFYFNNSTSKILEIESSTFEEIRIQKMAYRDTNVKTEIESLDISSSEITKSLRIAECIIKKISIYKVIMHETSNKREYSENILNIQLFEKDKLIENIDIHQSTIPCNSILFLTNVSNIDSSNTNFGNISLYFNKIDDLSFKNNRVKNCTIWGNLNSVKQIKHFEFNTCTLSGPFNLSNAILENKLHIINSAFLHNPSFISLIDIAPECSINFKYTNLNNLIFKNIDLTNFSFSSLDISGSRFEECEWIPEKEFLWNRLKVFDEKRYNTLNELIELKKIYSNLKLNFRANHDYITSGKFYVSEQEIKRRISERNNSYFEHIILTIHKYISSYGENVYKPFVWILRFSALFAVIYIFTGFYAGERIVLYELEFDPQNIVQTTTDWTLSFILSIKNILPFSFEKKFFLDINKDFALSQFFELLQKFIFMILIGSFTEAFVRYLKK